jgi:hypothetical protein
MRGLEISGSILRMTQSVELMDHFTNRDTSRFVVTATDAGTATVGDAANGIMVVAASDGTPVDNDETYVATPEILRIAAGRPYYLACLLQFTEVSTNAANVFFGSMDAVAANAIVDNGAGLKTSFSGAAFFKVDGSRNWRVIYSDGSTQTIAELNATTSLRKQDELSGIAAYQLLEIDVIPKTTTLCDVIFRIDGSTVFKMLDRTFANATDASVAVGVKAGSAVAQTLNVDAIAAVQRR